MILVLPKSQTLIKSRGKLKILNLNRFLLSGKSSNCRKSKRHWISSDKISHHYSVLRRCKFLYHEKSQLFKKKRYLLNGASSFPSNLFLRYHITLAPKNSTRILISIKKEKDHMNLIDSIHSIFIIFILILPCQNTR